MRIKKKDVIKALKTEPLHAKEMGWIRSSVHGFIAKNDKHCTVCAVGAVLRKNTDFNVRQISQFGMHLSFKIQNLGLCATGLKEYKSNIEHLLEAGQYLAALSCYYESTIPKRNPFSKSHRNRLCKFVSKHFPKEIEV